MGVAHSFCYILLLEHNQLWSRTAEGRCHRIFCIPWKIASPCMQDILHSPRIFGIPLTISILCSYPHVKYPSIFCTPSMYDYHIACYTVSMWHWLPWLMTEECEKMSNKLKYSNNCISTCTYKYINSMHVYIYTEKTSWLFNHRVVTTVADKLKRLWLWEVCFGTRN